MEQQRIEQARNRAAFALGILAALLLVGATLTIPYTFSPGTKIQSSQMNANFQAVRDVVNNLDDANISNDGITGSSKLVDLSVSTDKLADDSVTTGKIAANTIVAGDIATGGVATAEILDGDVATADLAANAATKGGTAITAGTTTVNGTTYTDLQSVTLTTTTTGPVLVLAQVSVFSSDSIDTCNIRITRNNNGGGDTEVTAGGNTNNGVTGFHQVLMALDSGAAVGSVVYKIQGRNPTGGVGENCSFSERRLTAVELRR